MLWSRRQILEKLLGHRSLGGGDMMGGGCWEHHYQAALPHLHPFKNSVSQVLPENLPQLRPQGIFPILRPSQNHFIFDRVASYSDLKPDPVPSSLLTGALSSVLSCTSGMLDMHGVCPSSGPRLLHLVSPHRLHLALTLCGTSRPHVGHAYWLSPVCLPHLPHGPASTSLSLP